MYYEEEIIDDVYKVTLNDSTNSADSLMVKSITYKPRICSEYIVVNDFSDRYLGEARHKIAKHMVDIITDNMKYMEVHDDIRGRKEYRISVSVLMEQEKIDYLDRISSLEQEARNLNFAIKTVTNRNQELLDESLFEMIKRWFKRIK